MFGPELKFRIRFFPVPNPNGHCMGPAEVSLQKKTTSARLKDLDRCVSTTQVAF
jgi:hypothetical protein